MRKQKLKVSNFVMIVLLLLALYYIYIEFETIRINAVELDGAYKLNKLEADKKFLNKEIELTGIVIAFYLFSDGDNLLELESEDNGIGIYCIIKPGKDNEIASRLTKGTGVKIIGICTGMSNQRFPNSIYIKVSEIK
ncbi:MAG TPA: hypothetical protein VI362_07390 [Ignavibacteriaceae bacterium]|nr:hypothetical protein [Ignavibacteriaceae bacterium]